MATPRVYEVVFIISPEANEDETAKLIESLQHTVTDQGGQITKAENMGRRSLAYEINGLREGVYQLFEVEGTGREIAELERRMRVSDQIMRYVTVRVDEDRRRAEKLRARRARKASKRTGGGGSGVTAGAMGRANAGAPVATAMATEEDES